MSGFQPRKYYYKTRIKWFGDEKGEIYSEGNPEIKIALPEQLDGPGGFISPDELFVSSVGSCAMLTFFWLLKNKDVNVISYESVAEGASQIADDGEFRFTGVKLKLEIVIANQDDLPKVNDAIKKLDTWCCISNSIKTRVIIEPKVTIEGEK
jgi:peroxiredoxin-like protein